MEQKQIWGVFFCPHEGKKEMTAEEFTKAVDILEECKNKLNGLNSKLDFVIKRTED